MADLYDETDGVLLPTVSNQVRTSRSSIVAYFTQFLKLKPYGTIDQSIVRDLGNGYAANSGIYTFRLTPETGVTKTVQARYSFIYKWVNGDWKIVEHHSSAMPEPVAAKVEEPVKEAVAAKK